MKLQADKPSTTFKYSKSRNDFILQTHRQILLESFGHAWSLIGAGSRGQGDSCSGGGAGDTGGTTKSTSKFF